MESPTFDLAATLERMTDAFIALDREWRCVCVNAHAARLFGRDAADLVGKQLWSLFPEEVGEPYRAAFEQAVATQQPAVVEAQHPPTGRWFESRCYPAPGGLAVFFNDVTERRRAEAALRESEARFRAVFEQSPLAIAIRGADDGRVLEANPAFERLLGYTAAELRGLTVDDLIHPDDRAANDAVVAETRAGRRSGFRLEKRYVRKDGGVVAASVTVASASPAPGAPPVQIAMVEDVTGRHEAEGRLREAQRLEAVGRLAGGVAHDFNNLLAVVLSYADLASEALPEDHPARADVGEIRRAAQRGAALTRQLLAFGRQRMLQPRRVELNGAVGEQERMLRRVLPPGVSLHVVPSPGQVEAEVDPAQLQEALLHLVVNARDAMPDGGGVTLEPSVRVLEAGDPSGAAPGRYAALTVRDRGVGMDAATRARAFEPFFTTKPLGEGTGLGLAMVHGFAAQSGGAVTLESAPGEGTAVTIYLPLAPSRPPAPPAVEPAARPAAAPARGMTVLVVEDEANVRRSIVRILERQGYRVIEARHGGDALLAWGAAGGAVDLLVTDLVMPELDGRDLAARLRAERPGLPVVVVSGYAGDAAPGGAPPIARALHLEKPFETADLVRAVADALAAEAGRAPMPGRHHVLLVPGFFGFANLGDFAYFGHVRDLIAELGPAAGVDGEIRVVPTPPTASLRVRAARLVETISELPEGDRVSLVGHSSGGLDARLAVTPGVDLPTRADAERCAARVAAVLTVATPHHGTPVAHLFNTFFGQELLHLLSVFTIAALRAGRLPLRVVLRAARIFRRRAPPGDLPSQLVQELLGGFSRERRLELQAFLSSLGADQDLLGQITPGAMDLFNAASADRPGLRVGCLVARARPPGLRSVLSAGFDPYAQATHALFVGLYRVASRTDLARAPKLSPEQRLALRRGLGRATDTRANDGMVPTLSQVWGEVVGAAWADHHDLIGHFDAPGSVPPHIDWLTSGSGFDRARFVALWRAAVAWLGGR